MTIHDIIYPNLDRTKYKSLLHNYASNEPLEDSKLYAKECVTKMQRQLAITQGLSDAEFIKNREVIVDNYKDTTEMFEAVMDILLDLKELVEKIQEERDALFAYAVSTMCLTKIDEPEEREE